MDVNAVNAAATANSVSSTTQSATSSLADKDIFLKILAAEMSNQDPLNASDDSTQQIAQLAQFSGLEQQQEMNTSISKMLMSQKVTEGASLIGKTVTVTNDDGSTYTDKVTSVKVIDNDVYVVTSKGTNNISGVSEVGA